MDEVTIQKIAAEVARHLPSYAWVFLLVQVLLMLAAAGIGAYSGAYLKERGKNLATKHDFDELQKQLEATTETVETIKAQVGQKDWAQREWTNLRRIKLEALIDKMHECEADLDRRHLAVSHGSTLKDERDYINEFINGLHTISTLYLPELSEETDEFSRQCLLGHFAVVGLDQMLRDAGDDSAARERAYDGFKRSWKPEERLNARFALQDAARRWLLSIMGVGAEDG
jgi:hypothetical protein